MKSKKKTSEDSRDKGPETSKNSKTVQSDSKKESETGLTK